MWSEEMTRLGEEIVSLRRQRGALLHRLTHDHQERNLAVTKLCTHFQTCRTAAARKARAERLASVHALQCAISAQRRAVRTDLSDVRKAWVGR